MSRDWIVLVLLAAILATSAATTALLFEERMDRREAIRKAEEMSAKFKLDLDKSMEQSKSFLEKFNKPAADTEKAGAMKELQCSGEYPNRKCEWK